MTCNGCLLEMLQRDFTKHQLQCSMIVTTCPECKIVYKQTDVPQRHSDVICLREQLQQLRQDSQREIQRLKEQIQQAQSKIKNTE